MLNHQQIINKIAQEKIDFNLGIKLLLENPDFRFEEIFATLKNYIFNAIPDKVNYNNETYQKAINTIPLKPTYNPIVLLKNFPSKTAFYKLGELPENENEKVLTSLLWIFKITDTERRNTDCKNGCGHSWHQPE